MDMKYIVLYIIGKEFSFQFSSLMSQKLFANVV